jgi:hypothetical protein
MIPFDEPRRSLAMAEPQQPGVQDPCDMGVGDGGEGAGRGADADQQMVRRRPAEGRAPQEETAADEPRPRGLRVLTNEPKQERRSQLGSIRSSYPTRQRDKAGYNRPFTWI